MSVSRMRAMITSEVTDEFLNSLEVRGIDYELLGWGQTGTALKGFEIVEKANKCQILIIELEVLNKEVIESLPNLRFIGVTRSTPINVDLETCEKLNIPVFSTPGRNADSVADYCLSTMLDLSRKITMSSRHLSLDGWMFEGKLPYLEFRGRELGNLIVGLYGLGQIGARVAQRLHDGFGAEVYYFDPYVQSSVYAKKVDSLEALFDISDIVSLHAPVTDETEKSVNRQLLKRLGPEGILISAARAKLIVEDDLYQSVESGEIASVAIDVFWDEPINSNNKWLSLPNAICTPHIAGASLDVATNHCNTLLNGLDSWLSLNNKDGELA